MYLFKRGRLIVDHKFHGATMIYQKILELIGTQFYLIFINKTINQKIDSYQYRVEINPNVNFAIDCNADRSILSLVFVANIGVQAKLPPSIKRISNMFVYSGIVELYSVGNS